MFRYDDLTTAYSDLVILLNRKFFQNQVQVQERKDSKHLSGPVLTFEAYYQARSCHLVPNIIIICWYNAMV